MLLNQKLSEVEIATTIPKGSTNYQKLSLSVGGILTKMIVSGMEMHFQKQGELKILDKSNRQA